MKKFTAIIVVLSLCLAFAGCTITIGFTNPPATEPVESTIPETTEAPTTAPAEETLSDIPGAKEFPEFEWPTFGAVTRIPVADWSTHGTILANSENSFWVQVGYSTLDNYNDYVKACQDAGFTEDYYNAEGYMYYGANADGYFVQLTYNQYDHYVAIQTGSVSAGWNKWWLDEG